MRPQRFRRLQAVLRRRQPDLTVLMEGVHKGHNFSAVLRNCDAVGVLEAHVVPPERGVDLHHGISGGTRKWVEVVAHDQVEHAVAHLAGRGFQVLAAHLSESAADFRTVDFTRPTAIVLGTELHGVTPQAQALAHGHVAIPMNGMVHSLNVSVAAALLLFEAQRQREAAGMYQECRLEDADFRRHLFRWAHPAVAAKLDESGTPYPELDEDGEITR